MHGKRFQAGTLTQLIQMCVVAAVFCGHSGAEVNKYQVPQIHLGRLCCFSVHINQNLIQFWCLLAICTGVIEILENVIRCVRQGNGAIATPGFGRACTPGFAFETVFQRFTNCQCAPLPINAIPGQANQLTSAQTSFKDQCVLIVVVGVFCSAQKNLLLVYGQKANLVWSFHGGVKPNTIHGVFIDQAIFFGCLEHGTQGYIRLANSGAGVSACHAFKHRHAVHGLDLR